jgi:hypothetical protein
MAPKGLSPIELAESSRLEDRKNKRNTFYLVELCMFNDHSQPVLTKIISGIQRKESQDIHT